LKVRNIPLSDYESMIDLRQKILHPKGERSRVLYSFDDHSEAMHFGVYTENLELVACGSLLPESEDLIFSSSVSRIRGMAVDEDFQKQGLGQLVLEELLKNALKNKRSKVWCNARTSILDFYLRRGFFKQGEEFILPGNIPHYKLIKNL